MYSCKICGCLFRSRADRKAHTLAHKQISRSHQRGADQPPPKPSDPVPDSCLLVFQVPSSERAPQSPAPCELAIASPELSDDDVLRASLRHPADATTTNSDVGTSTTSSDFHFRSADDLINSPDSASGFGSSCASSFCGSAFSDLQSNEVLDLTKTATGGAFRNPLPVCEAPDNVETSDFRLSLARERKSRVLDNTVRKLWQFKLQQQQSACGASEVASCDLEMVSKSTDHSLDLSGSCGDNDDDGSTRFPAEERPSFEVAAKEVVTGSRSPGRGEGQGYAGAELKLRRVVATPGNQAVYYTSLMRFHSKRCKPRRMQVSTTNFKPPHLRLTPYL